MTFICAFRQDAGDDGKFIKLPTPQPRGHFSVTFWREFTNQDGDIERETSTVSSRPSRKRKAVTMGYGEFHERFVQPLADDFIDETKAYLHWGFNCRRV